MKLLTRLFWFGPPDTLSAWVLTPEAFTKTKVKGKDKSYAGLDFGECRLLDLTDPTGNVHLPRGTLVLARCLRLDLEGRRKSSVRLYEVRPDGYPDVLLWRRSQPIKAWLTPLVLRRIKALCFRTWAQS